MKPIDFKERNVEVAKKQDEYITLPSYIAPENNENGEIVFCMGLNFWERVRLLFNGRLWCCLLMFGKPVTPSRFSTKKSDFFNNK